MLSIFNFLEKVYLSLNEKEAAAAVFLDLSKAFDCRKESSFLTQILIMKWALSVSLLFVLLVLAGSTRSQWNKTPPIVCDKPNEEYQCGSACQTRCIRLECNCPIQNVRCNDACYCKDGYARDENNECIPIADCSVPRNCSVPELGYGPAP
ncbi:unnamed protein product [Phaedon cochleariae]|uniref:TIL domain-containing protein n=1 Tax=Phaedon cochleariae TaxID=80249 RepID=A0A9N9X4R0_PHACE|nr:unnamed protein product [Phaedon cochleariae]